MVVPALYIRVPGADPVAVKIRLHNSWGQVGDIQGARNFPAEMENLGPRILFDLTELPTPQTGAVLSVAQGEAYRVDHLLPPDDQFQHALVTPMFPEDAVGLPIPEDV